MIRFENVSFEYEKGRPVLRDISFAIKKGESVGLIGANGAGKSTIMKAVLGLISVSGEVYVDGEPVTRENLKDIRSKLGFVFQNSDNQMFMPTVYEDMLFGPLNYGEDREKVMERADDILNSLNLSHLKNQYNHKISVGEKRMAAIATVLTMEPMALLMDEPTSALDPYNRRLVINTVNSLSNTKIITSHDLDMILDTCERVILISNGTIVADGRAKDILNNESLLTAHKMELPLSKTNR